jgi:hypothetical protein
MSERRILNSWKEIANYLGRGVRTVQRWEAQLGLPVHRPAGKDHSAVLAFSSELDQWLDSRPVRQSVESELESGSSSSFEPEQFKALLAKAEVMLERLEVLLSQNDQMQRKLSLMLDSAEDSARGGLGAGRPPARSTEIGAS